MGKGQDLYLKAKKIIPGGTQLLSKRPEMFLPDQWPSYYEKAKGCVVTDLDGNEYYDVSYMGIGACVLGYAFDPVDKAAEEAIEKGGMCTLNAPEEVSVAEKLLELHPWADMVRYSKAGGEAMAIATRIARTATNKDIVLVCGYHGWQDWYLATNLGDKSALNPHHLSGLDPRGVPKELKGTTLPFLYNDWEGFLSLAGKYEGQIAAVVMEPIRNDYPIDGFLQKIRHYTEQKGIVLVFDEITAGFRLTCGGSHLVLGVNPDIAVFAKGMGNGYPLSAIIGRSSIMTAAQETFISSTFWTERVGLCGALASITYFQEHEVEKHLESVGKRVQKIWKAASEKHTLPIEIGGILPLSHFGFVDKEPLLMKTYFIQLMLERGFLASTALYASLAHTVDVLDQYEQAIFEVFGIIKDAMIAGNIKEKLKGPVCHAGFQRLN